MSNKYDNYLKYSLIVSAVVAGILLLLYFIPGSVIEMLNLRRIDILSDIKRNPIDGHEDEISNNAEEDSPTEKEIPEIPCKEGMVCFEDYSENKDGLLLFYRALNNKGKRPVRIAFYGDSYIEGDIFVGDLRALLQEKFGGAGIGFVGATSITAGFRQTIKHSFGGWKNYHLTDTGKKDYSKMGMAGSYHLPGKNAWVKFAGVDKHLLDIFKTVKLIYSTSSKINFSYKINNEESVAAQLTPTDKGIGYLEIKDDSIAQIRFSFPESDVIIYGASIERDNGVIVDNFSLRGTPGTAIQAIPTENLKKFDSILNYDLIVLQYGLNVMSPKQTNYKVYQRNMVNAINHIKQSFPETSILLLSVGDRSMRKDGQYVTMPCVEPMVAAQREMCIETKIVFWNLFEAMGGKGSMVKFVNSKPAKANKDYTHLNFEGGKYLGDLLFNTIMFDKQRYDARFFGK